MSRGKKWSFSKCIQWRPWIYIMQFKFHDWQLLKYLVKTIDYYSDCYNKRQLFYAYNIANLCPAYVVILWRCIFSFSCVEKRIYLIHTARIISARGIAVLLVKCSKIKVLSLTIVFPWVSLTPCKDCKATGSCLYLPSVKNKAAENTNWPHRATFVLNWFRRYAQLQLYGSLVDLVLTALLSLATSNKHLPGLKNLCYASQKSFHTLKLFKANL